MSEQGIDYIKDVIQDDLERKKSQSYIGTVVDWLYSGDEDSLAALKNCAENAPLDKQLSPEVATHLVGSEKHDDCKEYHWRVLIVTLVKTHQQ